MKTASVTHLKNNLSARLKEVSAGEAVMITDRRKPIAILQPLSAELQEDRLASLYHRGILRPPANQLDSKVFLKMPRGKSSRALSAAVHEDREEQ